MKITFFSTQHFSNVKCMQSQAKPFHGLTSESELMIFQFTSICICIYIYYNFSCIYIYKSLCVFIYLYIRVYIHILCFMFIFIIIHLHIYIYYIFFQNIAFQISAVFCLRFLVIHALRLRWAANSAGLADACMIWRLRQDAGCDHPNAYSQTWTFF